ncbi:hypothetical protein DPV86_08280 [Haemophilus parahaemolyticus]|jgi:hypothetical protein|uniref:hypothetical protein n=1 Tax=Haemophilus parahaemolyticus TaxID=735 RepID=UPI000DAD63A3|nr:hypothetical protein [Haemophilus parahaemolyticus]MDU4465279.1 hypothetical protein [Haemophilus parahaemolyticus]RDE80576.1 hypothetical protein DPV86_08280 [Haemophilus parahaemolyticus]
MRIAEYNHSFSQMSKEQLNFLLKQMKKIADKQGVIVVMEDNALLTTYNLCSYNRKLSRYH